MCRIVRRRNIHSGSYYSGSKEDYRIISLKESYQTFIQSSYQNNCQNILKDFEDYCHNEYVTVPISTVAYGLAISSDVDQDNVRDLMINS